MVKSYGPFHSLSASDRARSTTLVSNGSSVRSAAHEVGFHYAQALNFCHAHNLVVPRASLRVDRDGAQAQRFVDVVRSGVSVHDAAVRCSVNLTVACTLAMEAGCHIRLSRYQRRARQTELCVEYLRLRLAGMTPRDTTAAVGIDGRLGNDFERGVFKSYGQRQEFIPTGSDATTYNRFMATLRRRHDVLESGRLLPSALPHGVDPHPTY